jgi:hypothetical protein
MESALIILFSVLIFFSIFALFFEIKDQSNAYTLGKMSEKDNINESIRKLKICLTYDTKTIKWRRILIATAIALLLIFGMVHRRLPEPREMLLYFVIIFMCFELTWRSYTARTTSEAIQYGEENMKKLRETLSKNHSFILPF